MEKMNSRSNIINWLEIPVTDMQRAKKFYENVFGISMVTRFMEETKEEISFFPSDPKIIQATSGRVSGGLVKNDRNKPSMEGVLIYLNANPSIHDVIDRIEANGGKILLPRTKIIAGYISIFVDCEGNRLALHAVS